jgi:hypothetical protein
VVTNYTCTWGGGETKKETLTLFFLVAFSYGLAVTHFMMRRGGTELMAIFG